MSDSPNIDAQADGMLRIALHRMAAAYPFHAHLLSASHFEADPEVSTMGVTVQHGRLTFLYAPEFVVNCSFAELAGLLHHEINHVLFGHVFDDPSKFPDEEARIIAQEVSANEFVREPLPGHPITLDQYPQLPPEEDTVTRYRRLVQTARKRGQKGSKNGPSAPKNGPSGPKNSPGGSKKGASVRPLDDHSVWDEARRNKSLGRMAVSVAIRQARQQMESNQWAALPAAIRQQIVRLAAGNMAAGVTDEVGQADAGRAINWRRELRRFVGRVLEIRPVFNRPPRRFPELVGIIPGQGRRYGKPRIMCVIDTSASLNTETLSCICQELDRLARTNEVVVVECDAAIQAVYPYCGPIEKIRGRGGTDLRPVFAARVLRRHRPDVVLYFTDGFGPAPLRQPKVPVMWCLTPRGEKPANWGHVLRLESGS